MSTPNVDFQVASLPSGKKSKGAKKRRNGKRAPKGGKRGNPGHFHGSRAQLLDGYQPEFKQMRGTPFAIQSAFWARVFSAFWERFPWYVPLDVEPEDFDGEEPSLATPEAVAAKKEIIDITQVRIIRHMRYTRTQLLKEENPFHVIMARLHEQEEDLPAPRRLTDWQLYMSKKRTEISAVFNQRWPTAGLPNTHKIAFRSTIARELLEQESPEYRATLEAEVQEIRLADEELENEPLYPKATQDELTKIRARENLAYICQPFLEMVKDYTGMHCTLIAGAVLPSGPTEFQIKLVTAGKTDGPAAVPWHLHDGNFRATVMGSYTRYLRDTAGYAVRQANLAGTFATHAPTSSMVGDPAAASLGPTPSLTALPLALHTLQQASPAFPPLKKRTQQSKKGKKDRRTQSDEEPDALSSDESSDDGAGDVDGLREDEDEDDEEDEDEAEEDQRQQMLAVTNLAGTIPSDVTVPTADMLGLNEAVKKQLDMLGDEARRAKLYEISKWSDFDRQSFCCRIRAASLVNKINGSSDPIPLTLFPTAASSTTSKGSKKRALGAGGEASAPPTRRSSRLQRMIPSSEGTPSEEPRADDEETLQTPCQARDSEQPRNPSQCHGDDDEQPRDSSHNHDSEQPREPSIVQQPRDSSHDRDSEQPREPSTVQQPRDASHDRDSEQPREPSTVQQPRDASHDRDSEQPREPSTVQQPRDASHDRDSEQPRDPSTVQRPRDASHDRDCAQPREPSTVQQPRAPSQAPNNEQLRAPSQPCNIEQPAPPPANEHLHEVPSSAQDLPSVIILNDEDWPKWLRDGFNYMESKQLGTDFTRALEWWSVLERTYGWITSSSGFGTENRPDEVQFWMRNQRRRYDKTPCIKDEVQYAKSWWLWWTGLQPEWRKVDTSGRPVIGGTGSWEDLERPGQNGMLIVLMALTWWGEIASAATQSDWSAAARDVAWVLSQMAAAAVAEKSTNSKRSAEDETVAAPPSKKTRRSKRGGHA